MINPVSKSSDFKKKLEESLDYIKAMIGKFRPATGIILGTGLGGLVKDVNIYHKLDYNKIPNFPVSTVESHHGYLIFGELCNHNVVVMQGRFHYYEGYNMEMITYPLNIMYYVGVKNLLVSNACGSVNPQIRKGDIMLMDDHINFHFDNPVKPYFFNLSNRKVYDKYLTELAEEIAAENGIILKKGVYCTLQGPNLETRSEYRFIRKIGSDVVGMSTVPEALLSAKLGIRAAGFSIVTDEGYPDTLKPAVLKEILEVAALTEPSLTLLIKKIVEKL